MKFSTTWKSSKKRAKQRKYGYNAPLHVRQKLVSAHLSKEAQKKVGCRSLGVRAGDKVKIMRGKYRGKEGKVEEVGLKGGAVFITGIDKTRKDGTKTLIPIEPSNIMITEPDLSDKRRVKKGVKTVKTEPVKKAPVKKEVAKKEVPVVEKKVEVKKPVEKKATSNKVAGEPAKPTAPQEEKNG